MLQDLQQIQQHAGMFHISNEPVIISKSLPFPSSPIPFYVSPFDFGGKEREPILIL
jgi:hypothetical protein